MTAKFENMPNKSITEYSITRTPFHNTGLIQIPSLGDDECLFARVSGPVEQEIIAWEAKCEGGPPTIPNPYGGTNTPWGLNANMVLLTFKIGIPVSIPIGNGGHVTIISGLAVYGRRKAEGVVRDYPTGKLPYEGQGVDYNVLPAANFQQGIVDPATTYTPPTTLHNPLGP